jgi:hypothetical protein
MTAPSQLLADDDVGGRCREHRRAKGKHRNIEHDGSPACEPCGSAPKIIKAAYKNEVGNGRAA